jgi:type IV fimbrial biogenesis protein FimT
VLTRSLAARRKARGFTLVEVAVVLVILGLLLLAVMPSMGTWMRNTQVRNTATSMQAGLAQARNEAIRRNVPVRFSMVALTNSTVMDNSCAVSRTGISWVVSLRDPAGFCATTPSVDPEADALVATNPLIVETNAGGVGGRNVVVGARLADGSNAGGTVTFNGFGRVVDASPVRFIDVNNQTAGADYRRLRIEIHPGGASRICDMGVATTTDPRYCATNGTP